jgi:hypothetical protein
MFLLHVQVVPCSKALLGGTLQQAMESEYPQYEQASRFGHSSASKHLNSAIAALQQAMELEYSQYEQASCIGHRTASKHLS